MSGRRYEVVRPLAGGEFGFVVLVCVHSQTGGRDVFVVLKIIPETDGDHAAHDNELVCLSALRAGLVPGTVHALGGTRVRELPKPVADALTMYRTKRSLKAEGYRVLALSYAQGVTIRQFLGARAALSQPLTIKEARWLWWQLVSYQAHAYERLRVCHNDIKLGNIMVETGDPNNTVIRMVDGSFSTLYDDTAPGELGHMLYRNRPWQCGTLCFMAPEKLFFTSRPWHYSAPVAAAGDAWSGGTLFMTLVLNGRKFREPHAFGARDHRVLSTNGLFTADFTDTVYNLVPSDEPWFAELVDMLVSKNRLEKMFVVQGVRLWMWTFALAMRAPGFPIGVTKQGNLAVDEGTLKGITASPLAAALNKDGVYIIEQYRQHGQHIYERAIDMFLSVTTQKDRALYFQSQIWDPAARCTPSILREGETETAFNPFYRFYSQMASPDNVRAFNASRHPRLYDDLWQVRGHADVDTMLENIGDAPCCVCWSFSERRCDGCANLLCSGACARVHQCGRLPSM